MAFSQKLKVEEELELLVFRFVLQTNSFSVPNSVLPI